MKNNPKVFVYPVEKISTFGFRGEAIPSVASVSRFEINTRRQESIEGTKVICEGGTIKTVESTGCPPGTTMSVRNLFFNVPARKKFLRSAATEEAHIQETVLLLTLSRLDTFIELRFDGRVILSIPQAEDIRTRASLLFGREMLKEMLKEKSNDMIMLNSKFVNIYPTFSRNQVCNHLVFTVDYLPVNTICFF